MSNNTRPQVIYGDTDSIMIHTGTDSLTAARELGARVKKEVNRRCVTVCFMSILVGFLYVFLVKKEVCDKCRMFHLSFEPTGETNGWL